jgi:hypothetical protein
MKTNSYYVNKRRQFIARLAKEYKGGKCQICGYDKCFRALELHHLDPTQKEFNISHRGHCRSWERVKKEINKCVLLCANCHREVEDGMVSCDGLEDIRVNLEYEPKMKIKKINNCEDCNKIILNSSKRCVNCEKENRKININKRKVKNRPTREEIIAMVLFDKMSFIKIGKKYNVSDNTIRKWCISVKLPKSSSEWRKNKEIFIEEIKQKK